MNHGASHYFTVFRADRLLDSGQPVVVPPSIGVVDLPAVEVDPTRYTGTFGVTTAYCLGMTRSPGYVKNAVNVR